VLLFKRILDFKQTEGGFSNKRGATRYLVGAKSQLKAKLVLPSVESEDKSLPLAKRSPMDWGGQLLNLSSTGASIRIHPAAMAVVGDPCCLNVELDNMLFDLDATLAQFRATSQHVTCGLTLRFADDYSRRAYLQLMEPIVIGSTFAPVIDRIKQDLPGFLKEQYVAESGVELNVWRQAAGNNPKLFELLVHDFFLRGSTESPELNIGFREGAKSPDRNSRTAFPVRMTPGHKAEVSRFYQMIVQNLTKTVPAEVRKLLELFAT
jgi:hypothetical protein